MEKHFGLRIDDKILAKFRYTCSYVGRLANSQIIQLILRFIADYEKKNREIPDEDLEPLMNLKKE